MAGVIFELTNAPVSSDESSKGASGDTQITEFKMGTFVTPSGGLSLAEPVRVAVLRSSSGSGTAETLFDSSKTYKITIEEL
jgi:hypothetical protein